MKNILKPDHEIQSYVINKNEFNEMIFTHSTNGKDYSMTEKEIHFEKDS